MTATTTLTVTVTAPTSENAQAWAQTLADLILAEHGDHMRLKTLIGPAAPVEPATAIAVAIRDFNFGFYGLDDVETKGPYAEWVGDLASAIAGALGTGPAPAPAETAEQRADREETEREHATGIHTHCGLTCETELPTEHLRNFVIAKGYPGTKGALDGLLRRAGAAGAASSAPALQAAPPAEIWIVCAEDSHALDHCTDATTAKLAAIKRHQEAEEPGDESVYGWHERGGHLELHADGADTGLRVSRAPVRGPARPPTGPPCSPRPSGRCSPTRSTRRRSASGPATDSPTTTRPP
ncbi:hypothetical protein [Streptomyces aureocirculatus]|uniref:hypothetical protein n=1 Tax=Streptomyces aureocirculatus TaxID=67275 RepID=UPI0004CBDC0B|nr:hypothetical protein [Streptomyces aureocirculatus]